MEEQLAKYFAGEANQEEKSRVLTWREESAENAEEFIHAKTVWLSSEAVQEANQEILSDIMREPETKVIGWPSFVKYAAAVVLLAMIGILVFYKGEEKVIPQLVFNGSFHELSDGTKVSLRNGATLEVIEFSDEIRRVKIVGKAFFEVVKDESRPFFVETADATVRVLGTSFQVFGHEDFTEVCVESGLVSLAMIDKRKKNMSLNLEKGEMGLVSKNQEGIVKRRITDKNFLAWKNGMLNFERANTADVVKTLNDVYGANISLDPELLDCKLSAQFNQKSLEEVVQIISATFNWSYKIDKDKVVLSGKGC